MLRRLAAFFPLVLILLTSTTSAQINDGKLLLEIVREEIGYRVVSAIAYPDAPAPINLDGNARFRLLGSDSAELAKGKVQVPVFTAHEYTDETGMLHGSVERVERFTISLPLVSGTAAIELKRGGHLLLEENISPQPFREMRLEVEANNDALYSYLPLLEELDRPKAVTESVRIDSELSDTDLVRGKIQVKGIKNTSLLEANIYLYPLKGSFEDRLDTTTNEKGKFSIRVPRGKYIILAYCYYRDPDFGGERVMLYPGRLETDPFESTREPLLLKWKKYTLFTGQLQCEGKPVMGTVHIVDPVNRPETLQTYFVSSYKTNENGRFAVRLPRKAFVMIATGRPDSQVGDILTLVKVGKTNVDVPIEMPPIGQASGPALKKIWDSGPENTKLNIVLFSEAYTNREESFTDLNGNGRWDGELYLDLNHNDQFDEGEYFYDRNENEVYDEPEPFEDLNSDGICNRNERALFELDAALAASALLSFPPFDRYSDVINIYTNWTSSRCGITQYIMFSKWRDMETAWNIYGATTENFQIARIPSDPKPAALNVLPNALELIPVILINDPLKTLRSNANFGFGRVLLSSEDHRAGATLIHELGHSLGNLWDEYLYDNPTEYTGGEPVAANVSASTDPALAKWSELIKDGIPVPTPETWEGYGLFEGAGSYDRGVYRSTGISMMRNTLYPFFIVNEQAMVAVLELFR